LRQGRSADQAAGEVLGDLRDLNAWRIRRIGENFGSV